MKLAAWRKAKGWTQDNLAEALGCSQPYVSQIERAADPIIPGPELMRKLYVLSLGEVQPNDFYDLPALELLEAAA